MTSTPETDKRTGLRRARTSIGLAPLTTLLALAFMVLIGATNISELSPAMALVSAALAIPFVGAYLVLGPSRADGLDRLVVLAVMLFVASCVLSSQPRLSFEPALAAVAYAAVLFVGRGLLVTQHSRAAFKWTLIALSALMTALTAGRWAAFLVEWMNLAGWAALPPLNMELPSFPWGHRHDLALLVVMVYPAWWLGRPSWLRKTLAAVVGLLVGAIVIVDGSRTLWLAIAAASIASSAMFVAGRGTLTLRANRQTLVVIAGIGLAIAALAVVSGVAGSILQRLGNLESVGWRTAMWTSLFESWLMHPVAGRGPGTFPWILQETAYFDTTSFAPRHPDSAPIQLIAEGGLFGLAAMGVVLYAVVPRLVRRGQKAAVWALTAFAIASLGGNPTDFAFMVIVAIAWTAYGLPRMKVPEVPDPNAASGPARTLTGARLVAAGVIGVAWLATWLGAVAHADAKGAVAQGDRAAAASALDRAIALDPGMALYVRERGTLDYVTDAAGLGVDALRQATRMNPWDDLAWRTLALAERARGDEEAAEAALNRAIEVQRSDPTNLMILARSALEAGDAATGEAILSEVVQAWPPVVTTTQWGDMLADVPIETHDVVDEATQRWIDARPAPEMVEDQGVWLLGMSGRSDEADRALAESELTPELAAAYEALLQCRPATSLLSSPTSSDLQTMAYWQLRMRNSAITSAPDPAAERMVVWMPRRPLVRGGLNPLDENSVRGTSTDLWGYRRVSASWPLLGQPLPSPPGGLTAWLEGSDCEATR